MLEEFVDLDALALGRALRRTRIVAFALGVIGLVVAPLVGYPPPAWASPSGSCWGRSTRTGWTRRWPA